MESLRFTTLQRHHLFWSQLFDFIPRRLVLWKKAVRKRLGTQMGLRQRTSLKRTQNTESNELKAKSSTRPSKKIRTRSAKSHIKLVASEPSLSDFLNPHSDFEAPINPGSSETVATPSRVQAAVGALGKLESEVIAALFPPSGAPPATLQQVSEELGMSVEEVQNIADEALRGLRGARTAVPRISKAWN